MLGGLIHDMKILLDFPSLKFINQVVMSLSELARRADNKGGLFGRNCGIWCLTYELYLERDMVFTNMTDDNY